MKVKRILALLLLFAALFSLSSCTDKEKKQNERVIATCAGYDVLYEELRYITLTYKDAFEDTYGEGIWDDPTTAEAYRAELEEVVYRILFNNYTVLAACNYYMPDITPSNSEIADEIDAEIEDVIEECGGKAAFQAQLDALHLTENFFRFSLTVTELENELCYVLSDDLGLFFGTSSQDQEAFFNWLEDGNCVYVQHIFISNDLGDDVEENRATAETVRQNLANKQKSVSDYVNSSVNEDMTNTSPYFIVRDVYTKAMEDAAFALTSDGDVSQVIETDSGFYVLVRTPHTSTTLRAQLQNLLYSYRWAKVEEVAETFRPSLVMEWNDYGKSIDVLTIS